MYTHACKHAAHTDKYTKIHTDISTPPHTHFLVLDHRREWHFILRLGEGTPARLAKVDEAGKIL